MKTKTLTFIKNSVGYTAVYLEADLIFYGEVPFCWPLLKVLGFICERLPDIEYFDKAPEFDKDRDGRWIPDRHLPNHRERQRKFEERKRQERIAQLKSELKTLEDFDYE